MDWIEIGKVFVVPFITGVAGWIAGRWKRRSDAIETMQKTIDRLSAKNDELYSKVGQLQEANFILARDFNELRAENIELKAAVLRLGGVIPEKKTKK